MQHKQRFTNVTLVTPYGEEDKDLLIDRDKIVDIFYYDLIIIQIFTNLALTSFLQWQPFCLFTVKKFLK